MKTAIIKTTFWDDESFEKLHLDSKVIYFYLMANPTRTLHKIIKLNPKIAQSHTGLHQDQFTTGLKQLIDLGLIIVKDRYYILTKDFVEAKKGRYTEQAIAREEQEIPNDILFFFSNLDENYTGTIPVHIDIDNNKDKDIYKVNNTNKFGEFENVKLTKEEYDKLVEKLGENNTKLMIEELSTGIASKGYRYKSHYATILSWSRRRVNKIQERNQPKQRTIV